MCGNSSRTRRQGAAARRKTTAVTNRRSKQKDHIMIDNTSSTVAAPEVAPVTPTKQKKTRGVLNQRHARALSRVEQIASAAQNEERVAALAAREISTDFVDQLRTDAGAARDKATEAVLSTTARRTATAAEAKAAKALLGGLNEVQKAAKQK